MGADAVLFIMGCAPIEEFCEWEALAREYGLAVLAESHSAQELEQALRLRTPLIGINNRDLTRFVTDVGITLSLKNRMPSDRILVTESGIVSKEIVSTMQKSGVNTYLVGGALMSADDPGMALADLFDPWI